MGRFTEAVKRMFSRSTTDVASLNNARVPFVDINGDPLGNDSIANLASVLGVYKLIDNYNPSDLNDVVGQAKGITYYFVASNNAPQNLPSEISTSTRFFLEVINSSGLPNAYDIIQRVTNRSSTVTYQRYRTGTSWSAWERL